MPRRMARNDVRMLTTLANMLSGRTGALRIFEISWSPNSAISALCRLSRRKRGLSQPGRGAACRVLPRSCRGSSCLRPAGRPGYWHSDGPGKDEFCHARIAVISRAACISRGHPRSLLTPPLVVSSPGPDALGRLKDCREVAGRCPPTGSSSPYSAGGSNFQGCLAGYRGDRSGVRKAWLPDPQPKACHKAEHHCTETAWVLSIIIHVIDTAQAAIIQRLSKSATSHRAELNY